MRWLPRPALNTMPRVVGIAVVAGVMFAAGILARSGAEASTGDWLSFAGALIGSGLTVAGTIAVLEWQRDSEQRALRALLRHLLDDAYEACTPFQCANPSALEEQYGKTVRAQVEEVQAAITRIHVFLRRMVPDTVTMMKVSDVLATLSFAPSENELTGLTFYPNDADLGGLNALGHDVRGTIDTARALLT